MIDFEITEHLYNVATYYQLLGERSKANAFKRSAMTLDGLGYYVQECIDNNKLMELPEIDRTIARTVNEILETGKLTLEDELAANFPSFIAELATVPEINPRVLAKISNVKCNSLYELKEKLSSAGIALPPAASTSLEHYIRISDCKTSSIFPFALTHTFCCQEGVVAS